MDGKIYIIDYETYNLDFGQIILISKQLVTSPFLDELQRQSVADVVYNRTVMNESFTATNIRLTRSHPDPKVKESLWHEITDPLNCDLQSDYQSKCYAFMQADSQRELIEKYFDKYYECVPKLAVSFPESKFKSFLRTCCPVARGSLTDLMKLQELQSF